MLALPMACPAKFGWYFIDFSLLGGQQYRFASGTLWGLELQFDRYRKSCLTSSNYYGFGLGYNFTHHQKEYSLKAMLNPTRHLFFVSRVSKFYPYLYAQGIYGQIHVIDPSTTDYKQSTGFSLRPGLGLGGNLLDRGLFSIRTCLQLGYDIPNTGALSLKNSLRLELKVGIALNARKLKSDKQNGEAAQ